MATFASFLIPNLATLFGKGDISLEDDVRENFGVIFETVNDEDLFECVLSAVSSIVPSFVGMSY